MKIASIILSIITLGLIIFNITKVDFNAPFQGESTAAHIEIIASLIALMLLAIFTVSKRIEKKIAQ